MVAPYLPSLTMRVEPLPAQVLPMTFWYSLSTEGTGTQARETPSGLQLDAGRDLEGAPARRLRVERQLLGEAETGEGAEQRRRGAGLQE